jgi:hypothetical protein
MRKLTGFVPVLLLLTFACLSLAQTKPVETPRQRLVATLLANFSAWDTNGDGTLDKSELARAVQDTFVTDDAAAAAGALKTAMGAKKAPKFPPFTREYFQSNDETLTYLTTAFRRAESRIRGSSGKQLFDSAGISLTTCKQGGLGDCYLVAATGAVITRDPNLITKMIQWQPEKSQYQVSYPDGFVAVVPALTPSELALGGAGSRDGLWLRVLEKAWGVRKIRSSTKYAATEEPTDVMGHGGSPKTALEAMTGHVAKSYRLRGYPKGPYVKVADLRQALVTAFQAHRLAVAGTRKDIKVPGINGNHAYAVIGYDAATDQVEVWNPHVNKFKPKGDPGLTTGYTTSSGRFSMPLADFHAVFGSIAIETEATKTVAGE